MAAHRLKNTSNTFGQRLLLNPTGSPERCAAFLEALGEKERALNLTDGLRIYVTKGAAIHLRPSRSAPELRVYVEAADRTRAEMLLARSLERS